MLSSKSLALEVKGMSADIGTLQKAHEAFGTFLPIFYPTENCAKSTEGN